MDTMTFCVPCLFGLEGLVGDELRRLDLQTSGSRTGAFFEGDFAAMAKANLCCRMGERVMICWLNSTRTALRTCSRA